MHISIQTIGTLGDVAPYVSLGLQLRREGHRVSILAPSDYTNFIQSHGLAANETSSLKISDWMRVALQRGTLSNPLNFFRDWNLLIEPQIDEVIDASLLATKSADLVIGNLICAPARLSAEYYEVPYVLTAQQPVISPSRLVPCAMMWRPWLPVWSNKLTYALISISQRVMERALRKHRQRLNLSRDVPLNDMRTHLGKPLPKITSVSQVLLEEKPRDWSVNDHLTTYPSLPHSSTPLPNRIEAFLSEGSPPIYIGLGSTELGESGLKFDRILAGLEQLDRRAIFTCEPVPDRALSRSRYLVVGPTAHDLLFPRCSVVIHHGGAGTVDTAIRAGKPQIVLPQYLDQFWYANALSKAGLSSQTLRRNFSVNDFVCAVSEAMMARSETCARNAARTSALYNGAQEISDTIFNSLA